MGAMIDGVTGIETGGSAAPALGTSIHAATIAVVVIDRKFIRFMALFIGMVFASITLSVTRIATLGNKIEIIDNLDLTRPYAPWSPYLHLAFDRRMKKAA